MSRCERFLEYFDKMHNELNWEIPDEVNEFYNILKETKDDKDINKPAFTKNGLLILKFMQTCGMASMKAKDIAANIELASKSVSGSMRKLVTDRYVEQFGKSPAIYALTAKGKEINLEENIDNGKEEKE